MFAVAFPCYVYSVDVWLAYGRLCYRLETRIFDRTKAAMKHQSVNKLKYL